jgi:2-polyprenyl-3-methyl-5-hydroxy-6-metoxy-1,4-benzoquinol methylase
LSRSILLVPSTERGNGSGHLVRCISLARALGEGASLFLAENGSSEARAGSPPRSPRWGAAELSLAYARELSGLRVVTSLPESGGGTWDLVVIDARETGAAELEAWGRIAPVVGIDEGGEARDSFHYLIDVLPRHPRASGGKANLASLGFLDLPKARRSPPAAFKRVLVTFGGEDSAGLTLGLARLLVGEGLVEPSGLTVVSGALRRGAPPVGLEGATVLGPVQDLKEHLSRFDLVLTQFGLTAFEAAWAGCGVVLLNPSGYHRELSRAAGFPEIGVGKPDLPALCRLLASPAELLAGLARMLPALPEPLADRLASLAPAGGRDCPSCGAQARSSLYRDEAKSYFRCSSCGLVYMLRFSEGRESPYKKSYFFEEYRSQYGKTYLEDWPALTALAEPRLDIIESLAKGGGQSLLDVGCAYGPFVAAAKARGLKPYGIDMAEDAVAYVRRELGIPAASGDFLDPAVSSTFAGPFDILTMWYVVEHFERLDRALRAAAALVRPGGVLALATPSLEGASGRFALPSFLARSPADHFTVWEPSRVRGILKSYGFRVERIRVTGHHPERLPGFRALAAPGRRSLLGKAAYEIGLLASRALGLGDTFEVYAVRETARAAAGGRSAAPGRSSPGSRGAAGPAARDEGGGGSPRDERR